MASRATAIIGTAVAAVVAYPFVVPALIVMTLIATRQGISAVVTTVVIAAAVTVAALILLPRLTRAILRTQRRWARLVFEAWKLWAQRRMLRTATARMHTTETDTASRDLGGESQ